MGGGEKIYLIKQDIGLTELNDLQGSFNSKILRFQDSMKLYVWQTNES